MAPIECRSLTLRDAADGLRRRAFSPVELTDAYLERIDRVNPALNAYWTVSRERAALEARQAEAEIARGEYRGPLHGVPIGLKDLFATVGVRTTAGSSFLKDWIPEADATVVGKLRAAGAVLLGKLATHEFAYGVTTNNPHFGPTRNPWDPARIPGGSSGGSAAAIAAGLAAATLGTDTGGSIRIPASLCGAVGLKPTYGRVSKAGVAPLSWLFDHAGPITHTVEDAALVLQAIAGYDPADPTSVRAPVDDYSRTLGQGVRGIRLGVPRDYFFARLDPEVGDAVEEALRVLGRLGAEVREVAVPDVESMILPFFGLVLAEAQDIHRENLASRPEGFGPDVRAILTQPTPSAAELMVALDLVRSLGEAFRATLEGVDALVTATTPVPAIRIGEESASYAGTKEPAIFTLIRLTAPFNATGLPALSLPCGFTRGGLPIGLQLVGRPFDEATVLGIGHAYEQATDWHRRRPEV